MKLLILGSAGQIGWELQRSLCPLGEIHLDRLEVCHTKLVDFLVPQMLTDFVSTIRPDVIVNAAAYTAVDLAEKEPEKARLINAIAPGVLASEARISGALLIHYSSDYVFDGSGDMARTEHSDTNPLSVYGRTKLEGEELIRGTGCRHVILRTSWVHASRGKNFLNTVLRLAAERDSLDVVCDQVGAPTGADLLADVTAHVVRDVMSGRGSEGTYHCVASGEVSWFDYAQFITRWARSNGLQMRLSEHAIRPVSSAVYVSSAIRPLNSRLSTTKLCNEFEINLPHWQRGVERTLREICGHNIQRLAG
jgi:dTDP-4-dehydrorhamnose reductase